MSGAEPSLKNFSDTAWSVWRGTIAFNGSRQVGADTSAVFPPGLHRGISRGRPVEKIREGSIVVVRIESGGGSNLFQIVCAGNSFSHRSSLTQRRQQHASQNRDYRDNHKQFDQRET